MPISDEKYFELLRRWQTDPQYKSFLKLGVDFLRSHWQWAVAAGVVRPEAEPEKISSPEFCAEAINSLRTAALELLGDRGAVVRDTAVFLLPAHTLNAFAAKTPRGTPFIVLNQDVIGILGFYTEWFCALYPRQDTKPSSRGHTQEDFADGVVGLAHYASTRDPRHLMGLQALKRPSTNKHASTFAYLIELSILMHEFGHIILGHLNSASELRVALSSNTELVALKQSRLQEFQADAFAFQVITAAQRSTAPQGTAFCMGLLFKFFELCHRLYPNSEPEERWTHPHPAQRWEAIFKLSETDKFPDSLPYRLDAAFRAIFQRSGR